MGSASKILGIVHGIIFCVPLVVLLWTTAAVLSPILVPFALFKRTRHIFMWWKSLCLRIWVDFIAFELEYVAGTKVVITRDHKTELIDEPSIIICNHPTHIDWYPAFCLLNRFLNPSFLRIFVKEELRHFPIFGWAWGLSQYVFLQRKNREADVKWIDQCVRQWRHTVPHGSWMVFPEGTDLNSRTLQKSKEFADSKGLPELQYVIYPKTTGFARLVGATKPIIKAVYDITLAYQFYAPGERPMEPSLALGRFPPLVQMHIKRYDALELPQSEAGIAQWCLERFQEKNDLLAQVYKSPEAKHEPLTPFQGKPLPKDVELRAQIRLGLVAIASFAMILFGVPLLLSTTVGFYYCIFTSVTLQVLQSVFGLDRILLWLDTHRDS